MKKLGKLFTLLMCTVFMGGVLLTSCGGDDDGGGSSSVAVTGVTLNETKKSVTVGSDFTLTATVEPEDATNKDVGWTSTDTTVATVDDGKVTAKKTGTATIQVKTNDGSKTAECAVTVKAKAGTTTLSDGTVITVDENGVAKIGDDEVTVSQDADGVATYTKTDGSSYTVNADGSATAKNANGDTTNLTAETTVTATEDTAKGTYTYTDGDDERTIIAVGGKIIDVTAGTDKGEQVGTYTITDGTVTGSFSEDSFTAETDKDGYIESITIGEITIELTRTSGNTAYTLKASESQSDGDGDGDGEKEETPAAEDVYAWTFADLANVAANILINTAKDAWITNASELAGKTATASKFSEIATNATATDDNGNAIVQFNLLKDVEYPSTGKTGLTMKVLAADSGSAINYNRWSADAPSKTNSAIVDTASAGYLDAHGSFLSIAGVPGPFKVEVIYCANSSKDKTDRHAYVKIGETEYKDPENEDKAPAAGSSFTAKYTGSDSVTVVIGATGFARIHDIKITPISIPVTEMSVTPATINLAAGGTQQLTVTTTPEEHTDTITYTSSDTSKVEVSETGLITAKAATTDAVTITVKANDRVSKTVSVRVVAQAKETENISLNKTATTIARGQSETLTATIDEGSTSQITWASDKAESGITVEGGVVSVAKTVAAGTTANITATANGYDATCVVTVGKIPVTDVTLDAATKSVAIGGTFDLTATIAPEDAASDYGADDIEWATTDATKASVTKDGTNPLKATVKGVAESESVEISVTVGGKSAKCAVTVTDPSKPVDVTWDWTASTQPNVTTDLTKTESKVEGKTGYAVSADSDSVVIEVDATTGKLSNDSSKGRVQFTAGAILKVPVSNGSVVTIKGYNNDTGFSVAGIPAYAGEVSYTAASAGFVKVVSTGSSYLASIAVTGVIPTEKHDSEATLKTVAATALEISATTLALTVDEPVTVKVKSVTPNNSTDKITWSVPDGTPVILDYSGAGYTCTITATKAIDTAVVLTAKTDSNISATCSVTAEAASDVVKLTTWDFSTITAADYYTDAECKTAISKDRFSSQDSYSAKSGYIKGSSSKVLMHVDCSADGAYVKTPAKSSNDYRVEVGKSGSIIRIPVSVGSVVTVHFQKDGAAEAFTINDTKGVKQHQTFTATSSGYVELKTNNTSNGYLYNTVTVTNVNTTEAHNTQATGTIGEVTAE